tara:strand:+ start:53 stop:622 length:570 start_codon:yes stop_codon:yes gene_type:complete
MKTDPRIDDYIARAAPFAQPILEHVRKLAHAALPEGEETLKWGVPYFTLGGKNVVGMAAFKAHVGVMLADSDTAGGGMGSFGKLASLDDLPADAELIARFRQSAEAVKSGKKPKGKTKPPVELPDDFATALADKAEAQKIFAEFTEAQRRDYVEWVTSAKREATRASRIATAVEWISEGKRRNWKYENC